MSSDNYEKAFDDFLLSGKKTKEKLRKQWKELGYPFTDDLRTPPSLSSMVKSLERENQTNKEALDSCEKALCEAKEQLQRQGGQVGFLVAAFIVGVGLGGCVAIYIGVVT